MAFMDLQKTWDRIGWNAQWLVLREFGIGWNFLKAVQSFYSESRACV